MKQIIYIDNFLVNHGHTPTTGISLVEGFRRNGYRVIPTSSKNNKLFRLADMVGTILAYRKSDLVLIATYSASAFYFACICAAFSKFLKIPYVPCLHGGNLPERIKNSPRLAGFLFGKSFTNVAVSGFLKEAVVSNGWPCIEIPNSIPLSEYVFRQRMDIQPKLLWVRSFHSNYHPQLAIKVLYRLRQNFTGATLTMIGPDKDDNSLEKCKAFAKDLHLENFVTFIGLMTQKEWTGLSADYDIFINTTNFDNLPVSVIEAMALGLVIVTTNVGGIPYLIEEGKTGLMVSPNDEEAFTEAVERVLKNASLAESLSKNANKKSRQFDWENVRLQWEDLFHSISKQN